MAKLGRPRGSGLHKAPDGSLLVDGISGGPDRSSRDRKCDKCGNTIKAEEVHSSRLGVHWHAEGRCRKVTLKLINGILESTSDDGTVTPNS